MFLSRAGEMGVATAVDSVAMATAETPPLLDGKRGLAQLEKVK
jgi:hypothetical protein